MSRLDDYRIALLAAHPDVTTEELTGALHAKGETFAQFIIDHGLGPLWHERTSCTAFHESRMRAEALYLGQEKALREIGSTFDTNGVDYVIIKGAANRLLLYDNPALRACYDFDILVRPEERVGAAKTLVEMGFAAAPSRPNISRALELFRSDVDVDLHWGLLREGRLRSDPVGGMLERRRRIKGMWMQSADDVLFTLLVHPAFAKHLAGWNMGLHRVADLLLWLRDQDFEWRAVEAMLEENGVRTAAWATLRWTQLLGGDSTPVVLQQMLGDLRPGRTKRRWIDFWLRNDLPGRTSRWRLARLLGFSSFLHDTAGDAGRAFLGRHRAAYRSKSDLDAFRELTDE